MIMCSHIGRNVLQQVLGQYDMRICWVDDGDSIPGSHWGESEAGLIANKLYVRDDTPLHSALHEACHYVCMDEVRRSQLHTDAGGGYDEENAVCYLQVVLSDYFPEVNRARAFSDMDDWGYSFRLGSAKAWFDNDASDAKTWLLDKNIINEGDVPTWCVRKN